MDKRTTDVVAYLTWVGLVIALVIGDRYGARFHLNQALVLVLSSIVLSFVAIIPILGWLVFIVGEIFLFICWIIGLVSAIQGKENPVPLVGGIQLLK